MGNFTRVKELIKGTSAKPGVDPNCRDYLKRTPLTKAAKHGKEMCIRHLLKSGADPNIKDKLGHTPVWYAITANHTQCAGLLINLNIYHLYKHGSGASIQIVKENISGADFITTSFKREHEYMSGIKKKYFKIFENAFKNEPYFYSQKVSMDAANDFLDPDTEIMTHNANCEGIDENMVIEGALKMYKKLIRERWFVQKLDEVMTFFNTKYHIQHHTESPSAESIDEFLDTCRNVDEFLDTCRNDYAFVKIFIQQGEALNYCKHIQSILRNQAAEPVIVSIVEISDKIPYPTNTSIDSVRHSNSSVHLLTESLADCTGGTEFDIYNSIKNQYMEKLTTLLSNPPYSYSDTIVSDVVHELLNGESAIEDIEDFVEDEARAYLDCSVNFSTEHVIVFQLKPSGSDYDHNVLQYQKHRTSFGINCKLVSIVAGQNIKEFLQELLNKHCGILTLWIPCDEHVHPTPVLDISIQDLTDTLNEMTKSNSLYTPICKLILHVHSSNVFIKVIVTERTIPGGMKPNHSSGVHSADSKNSKSSDLSHGTPSEQPPNPTHQTDEIFMGNSENKFAKKQETITEASNVLLLGIGKPKDFEARKIQNESYIKLYRGIRLDIVEKYESCEKWREIIDTIKTFLSQPHDTPWRGRIVFNGHGNNKGLCVTDFEEGKPLDDALNEIKAIYEAEKRGSNLFGLDVVFAQCFCDNYSFISNDIYFRVIPVLDGEKHNTCGVRPRRKTIAFKDENDPKRGQHLDLNEFFETENSNVRERIVSEKALILNTMAVFDSAKMWQYCTQLLDGYKWRLCKSFDHVFLCHAPDDQTLQENLEHFFHGCCHHKKSIYQQQCENKAQVTIILMSTHNLEVFCSQFCPIQQRNCGYCPLQGKILCLCPETRDVHCRDQDPRLEVILSPDVKEWAESVQKDKYGYHVNPSQPAIIDCKKNKIWVMESSRGWQEQNCCFPHGGTIMAVCSTLNGFVICWKKDNTVAGFSFNQFKKSWSKIENWPDSFTSLASVSDQVFALGKDKLCFRYDGENWTPEKEMLENAQEPLCADMLGRLWVIANPAHKISLQTLEVYGSQQSEWQKMATYDAIEKNNGASGEVLHSSGCRLYLLGGLIRCCATYDFNTDTWENITTPSLLHVGPSFVYHDKIILLGCDSVRQGKLQWNRHGSESFNIQTQTWEPFDNLDLPKEVNDRPLTTILQKPQPDVTEQAKDLPKNQPAV